MRLNRWKKNSIAAALLLGSAAGFAASVWMQSETASTTGVDASIRGVTDEHGSIQSIRGIEGIDTVMLENLEVVLRMQDRPQENQGKGSATTAASLMAGEPTEQLEEIPDARELHLEFELEGS